MDNLSAVNMILIFEIIAICLNEKESLGISPKSGNYIHNLSDGQCLIQYDLILNIEVTQGEVNSHIVANLDENKVSHDAKVILSDFTKFSAVAEEELTNHSTIASPITYTIAFLLLTPPEQRPNNSDSLKEGLGNLYNGCQDILQGAISDDPKQIEAARNQMKTFRRYLENQGITVSDDFDTLPDKLRQRCQAATTDPELKERAQEFVKSTEEIKQSFTNLLQTLKGGAEKLREVLDEVNGRG